MISQAIDVADLSRFEKLISNEKFINRLCVDSERDSIAGWQASIKLALIFTVKESVLKALGIGLSEGLSFYDIEYSLSENSVKLSGKAREVLGKRKVFVSTTKTDDFAFAFCVIE